MLKQAENLNIHIIDKIMRTCICLKEVKVFNADNFQINHKYKFKYDNEYFSIIVYLNDRYPVRFTMTSFNDSFIDLQEHRQKIINSILCEPVSV